MTNPFADRVLGVSLRCEGSKVYPNPGRRFFKWPLNLDIFDLVIREVNPARVRFAESTDGVVELIGKGWVTLLKAWQKRIYGGLTIPII